MIIWIILFFQNNSSSSFTFVKGTTTLDKPLTINNTNRTLPPIPPRIEMNNGASPTSPSQELFQSITLTPTSPPIVGRKLENLLLNDIDDEFDPRKESPPMQQIHTNGQNGHSETNGNGMT